MVSDFDMDFVCVIVIGTVLYAIILETFIWIGFCNIFLASNTVLYECVYKWGASNGISPNWVV